MFVVVQFWINHQFCTFQVWNVDQVKICWIHSNEFETDYNKWANIYRTNTNTLTHKHYYKFKIWKVSNHNTCTQLNTQKPNQETIYKTAMSTLAPSIRHRFYIYNSQISHSTCKIITIKFERIGPLTRKRKRRYNSLHIRTFSLSKLIYVLFTSSSSLPWPLCVLRSLYCLYEFGHKLEDENDVQSFPNLK